MLHTVGLYFLRGVHKCHRNNFMKNDKTNPGSRLRSRPFGLWSGREPQIVSYGKLQTPLAAAPRVWRQEGTQRGGEERWLFHDLSCAYSEADTLKMVGCLKRSRVILHQSTGVFTATVKGGVRRRQTCCLNMRNIDMRHFIVIDLMKSEDLHPK